MGPGNRLRKLNRPFRPQQELSDCICGPGASQILAMGAQAVSYGVAEEDASWYIEPRFPKTPHPVPAMSSVKSQRGASAEFFLKSCLCLFSFPAGSDFQNVFLALSKRVGLLLLLSVHGPVRDGTS